MGCKEQGARNKQLSSGEKLSDMISDDANNLQVLRPSASDTPRFKKNQVKTQQQQEIDLFKELEDDDQQLREHYANDPNNSLSHKPSYS